MSIWEMLRQSIWLPIKQNIKLYMLRDKMKQTFPGSHVLPENVFSIDYIAEVGQESYGFFKIIEFGNPDECRLHIGAYNSIGQETTFIMGGQHRMDLMSTYPFDKRIFGEIDSDRPKKGDIILEDDVWIGYGATILSGVHIGQGAVIGARSVVAKDVPPYSVYAGEKIVKKRFDEETIQKLMKIDYDKLTRAQAIKFRKAIEEPITNEWFKKNNEFVKEFLKGEKVE